MTDTSKPVSVEYEIHEILDPLIGNATLWYNGTITEEELNEETEKANLKIQSLINRETTKAVNKALNMFESDIGGWDYETMVEDEEDERNPTQIVVSCAKKSKKYVINQLQSTLKEEV